MTKVQNKVFVKNVSILNIGKYTKKIKMFDVYWKNICKFVQTLL